MPLRSSADSLPPGASTTSRHPFGIHLPVIDASWKWLGIVAVGLVAVNVFHVVRNGDFASPPKPTSDGPVYENIAYHLSVGHGFWIDWHNAQWRTIYEQSPRSAEYKTYLDAPVQSMPMTGRPPLFPVLIAGVYSVVGRDASGFAIVRMISALCIAFACSIAVANAAQILWNAKLKTELKGNSNVRSLGGWSIACGCVGATLLAASNRTLISYSHDFLTEPLALLLTQLLVTLLLFVIRQRQLTEKISDNGNSQASSPRWWVIAVAVVLAAMILARSLFVLWIPGVWLLLVVIANEQSRWRAASQVVLLTLLFMSPWWVRNCVVLERLMPLGTQGPITMLGGYCDEALATGGDWQHAPEQRLRTRMQSDPVFNALPTDVARELMIADEAKLMVRSWVAQHVWDLPSLFISRVVTHWNPYTGKSLIWRLLILIGAIYLLVKRRPEAWVLVGLPVMNTILVACMYTTGGRFLVPLYGILFTLSAVGMGVIAEWLFSAARLLGVASTRQPRAT